jgi:hypothetical protein
MPSSTGSALTLAAGLRALDDEHLLTLLKRREVKDSGIDDFFDLAERLLERSSVQSTLTGLDRRMLLTIAVICELRPAGIAVPIEEIAARILEIDHPGEGYPSTLEFRGDRLASYGLVTPVDGGYLTFDTVCDVLASWPSQGLPGLAELSVPLPKIVEESGGPITEGVDTAAAERAFLTSVAVIELLEELESEPIRELARGGTGVPDLKRVSSATGVPVEQVPVLLRLTADSGLIALRQGVWRPTDAAADWSSRSAPERWVHLARSWSEFMVDDVRFIVTGGGKLAWGHRLRDYLEWSYPAADDQLRSVLDQYVASAELLGIVALHTASTPGAAILENNAVDAEAAMRELLPAEVDKVYLQNDLTIIAPGPLPPALHERLRGLAVVDARGLATTYRVTAESLSSALERGETEESLLTFLGEISLTGIPQPLRYLISEAAGRYGLLRVGTVRTNPTAGRVSYARSTDPVLLETLLVDRRLGPLGIKRDADDRATSRFDRDVLYFALLDAHYPVAAEDASGTIVPVVRQGSARQLAAHTAAEPVDHSAAILARLRASAPATSEGTAQAWLERQLELAVKNRLRVTVAVTMPNGTVEDYILEPTGLASGRLRARDRKADIERTLPLSRIVGVREADAGA